MVTHERLLKVLKYNRRTGVFYWKVQTGPRTVVGAVAGTRHVTNYLRIRVDGTRYLAHRLAWFYVHGVWPAKLVDHKNRDPSDNRISNLRVASKSDNGQNQVKANSKNRLGLIGVSKIGHSFVAQITLKNKTHYLGSFKTAQEASEAYWNKKREIHKFWRR